MKIVIQNILANVNIFGKKMENAQKIIMVKNVLN
jgi:hypothetical protein